MSNQFQSRSRFALAAGFGGLLAIMALAGADALRVLRQIRREDEQIRRQFLSRNHVLNDIRSDLYLSGTYVRDYLLEPDPARAGAFKANLQEVRGHMQAALLSYGREVEPGEREYYNSLSRELSEYWKTLDPVLTWGGAQRSAHGYAFLRDQVFPRRTAMLGIAGSIAATDEQQLNAGNERVVALLLQFQNRMAVSLLATLALGLGMAAFSTKKILALEAHAQARYKEVSDARRQLTELSASLVQAQETERRALSRELHDEIGQSLSAVLVEMRNLSTGLAVWPEHQTRDQVELIKGLVENTVGVVRNLALLLRPSMLDDLGLIPALRWQAREVSKRTSMDVSVTSDLSVDDLPDEYKTCIYRVVQEALHNCARHSNASTVRIRVLQDPGLLAISIQDDGKGFDAAQSKGLGLLGIEERAARLGGRFEVHSDPGKGTTLRIELPFSAGTRDSGSFQHEADPHSVGR